MKDGDLSPAIGKLQQSLKQLKEHWEEAREKWHDVAMQHFEKDHLVPMLGKSTQAGEAMSRMAIVLAQAIRECS